MKKYLMIALFGFALTAMTSCTVDGLESTATPSLDDTGGQHSIPPPPPPPPGTNP